jgi:hypothetical protein
VSIVRSRLSSLSARNDVAPRAFSRPAVSDVPENWPAIPSHYLGHIRIIGSLQDPYVIDVGNKLQQKGYEAHWFRKENLPSGGASDEQGWRLFYGLDGRYLILRTNHEVLLLAVRK